MWHSIATPPMWFGFMLFIFSLLALDLGVFHRKAHAIRSREALIWTGVWIGLALLFNVGIWWRFGHERALEFLTGFLIEKALSVDNIFVFVVLFSYFGIPSIYQHRVLFWGILGAMVTRIAFILMGAALLNRFEWIIFLFGGFLIYTGIKILLEHETEVAPERNRILKLFRRCVPAVTELHGTRFLIRKERRLHATPLLVTLVVIEATDVVFAVDSIPAIFAVTKDPFIVFTSNIFAILGLRSLYFLLARFVEKFHFLNYGLGIVLIFVGFKMLVNEYLEIPITLSLGVVGTLLAGSIVLSLLIPPDEASDADPTEKG
ncbi:MAG: TerC family protein [Deltaproteobacteria bacterium]|nr:MAG: TerC family protein [Deltaproteobacteria bacterium]